MNQKFSEFLVITKALNKERIIPVLMGSLGLEYVTNRNWNARDIDIHISGDKRGWDAPDEVRINNWSLIVSIMEQLNYDLIDLHEHEFVKNDVSVEFGVKETLPEFAGVSLEELELKVVEDVRFYVPSLESFLKIYQASSQDSYRGANNNNKDIDKIKYLEGILNLQITSLEIKENTLQISQILKNHQENSGINTSYDSKYISLGIQDEERYVGGLVAKRTGNRYHISLLAIHEDYQKKGLGKALINKIEKQAIKDNCLYLTVNTQEYQGLAFYQALGFSVFGKLEDCPFVGTTKYYLEKKLKKQEDD